MFPNKIFLFITKVLILTILFTVVLIKIFPVHKKINPNSHIEPYDLSIMEKTSSTVSVWESSTWWTTKIKKEFPKAFQQDISNLIESEHRDAYVDSIRTTNWCHLDETICEKIIRASEYNDQQELRYQNITIGIINNIDNILQKWNSSQSCLEWIKLYKDDVASRWSATHFSIKMNTAPIESYREYRQVLTHELGHIIDLCWLEDSKSKKDSLFTEFWDKVFGIHDASLEFYKFSWLSERVRKKWSLSKDFISGYASKNPFEDFAESQNAYLNHPKKFFALAKTNKILMQKYNYFVSLYGDNTFNISEYPEKLKSTTTRIWDTTRRE